MSDDQHILFNEAPLFQVIENQKRQLFLEIEEFPSNYILNASIDDLCEYLYGKYELVAPVLKTDQIKLDYGDARIDVSQNYGVLAFETGQPIYVQGTLFKFIVPFDGEAKLFDFSPSAFFLQMCHGSISGQELQLTYRWTDHDHTALRKAFDRDIQNIQEMLESVQGETRNFNSTLRQIARQRIEQRREKLLKDQGMVAALGFPLKKRDNAPQTYTVPVSRRKLPIEKPPVTTTPFKPEPTLEMKEYEHILTVISNMVQVMERSPKAFSGMKEEDLRSHLLVQLNAQYEGQATGETFNFEGKTDILIRVEGKNIFIAECLVWDGPEYLRKKIDQLLGYASWRDTKAAIIIFNRSKNFSSVLAKIPDVVQSHPNFKRKMDYPSETGFRFVIHQRDDKNREITLTVLAFEVPS